MNMASNIFKLEITMAISLLTFTTICHGCVPRPSGRIVVGSAAHGGEDDNRIATRPPTGKDS